MAEGSPTRINVDGIVAILAIAVMAWIALLAGGYYIVVVAIIVLSYGGGVLAASDDRPIMTSLHVAFLMTLLSFFLGLPLEPWIAWLVAILATLLAYAVFRIALRRDYDASSQFKEYSLRSHYLFAFVPVALLVSIGVIRSWEPLWYYGLALLAYSLIMLQQDSMIAPNRFLVGTYLALCIVSLGALVDVSSIPPLNSASGVVFFHIVLQILIFFGCGVVGLALPFFVIRDARR